MTKEVNKTEELNALEPKVVVTMDDTVDESTDFVAVLSKENGDASIYYNTDALTLGMSLKIVAKEFVRCMNQCTEEEQKEVANILGESFICDVKEDILDA